MDNEQNVFKSENGTIRIDDRPMFCTQCGKKLEVGAVFCTNCGASNGQSRENSIVSGQQSYQPQAQAPQYYPPNSNTVPSYNRSNLPQKKEGTSSTVIIVSIVCAVLLVAAIALIFVFVIKPGMRNITLSPYPSELELLEGSTGTIQLVISPESAKKQALIWVTSNPSVATVEDGVVSAIGAGECKITVALAKYAKVYADINVTVTSATDVSNVDRDFSEITADMVYPNCYLTDYEVDSMDLDTIQFFINTIYAKNGYIFQTPSIAAYFELQPWYNPITNDTSVISKNFSEMDNANILLLVSYRSNKNYDNSYNSAVIGSIWTWSLVNGELSESFVSTLSDYDVQLLIDTIYAKNGYIFQTPSIQALFETQYWYDGWTSNAGDLSFSTTDQENLALLGRYR